MKSYIKITYLKSKYEDLPIEITKLFQKNDYVSSYVSKDTYVIGLQVRDEMKQGKLELEYNIIQNRFLTKAERESKVPKDRELYFSKYGVEIFVQYYLEDKTDVLKQTYQIYSLDTNEKLESYKEDYFMLKNTFERQAELVYGRVQNEKAYETYTDEMKASFWAGRFDRWMRQMTENGMDEFEFFKKESFQDFRIEEPRIYELMPKILTILENSDICDENEYFKQVNNRLGTSYVPES